MDAAPWLDGAEVLRPRDLREARDAVLHGAGRVTAVIACGGTSKLGWGGAPERVDQVIDTTGLDRLLEHDPGDMTATVQAGMKLADLQAQLAAAGQELAVDPPLGRDRAATIGGVFSASDSGPRRLGHGSLRELVIGMTVILADGTVARSGGKVIKNVAGYDLARLFCGAFGTLGLVAELTVRLHPRPERASAVRIAAEPDAATRLALALMASPLEPAAVDYDGRELVVGFEGRGARVAAQCERARALAARCDLDGAQVDGEELAALWHHMRAQVAGEPGETVVRIGTLPAGLAALAEAVAAIARSGRGSATLHSHACLGLHTVRIAGDRDAHPGWVHALRARARELGGHAVVRRSAAPLDSASAWGPAPPAIELMRRVKERFDPGRRFAPGRLVGGL